MTTRAMTWFEGGGPVMPALLVLGIVMYAMAVERFTVLYGQRAAQTEPTEWVRGLLKLRALVAVAPLLGLLGTVSGMIVTFDGIVVGGHADMVAAGVGEAMRTTQYGLALAVPGLLAERMLSRKSARLVATAEAVS